MEFRTGSLVNTLHDNGRQPEPEVGMGVTFLHWSDRTPGTIVSVARFGPKAKKAGQVKSFEVVPDSYRVVKGSTHDGSAQYEITPTREEEWEGRAKITVKHTAKGWTSVGGTGVAVGFRDAYYDPTF